MSDTLDGNTPQKRSHWLLVLSLFSLLCLFCYFQFVTVTDRYYKRLDRQSPQPTEIQLSESKIITRALPDCAYGLLWLDDETLGLWDCNTNEAFTINVETGELVQEKYTPAYEGEPHIEIFEPTGKDKAIAMCLQQNLVIRGGSKKQGEYEITLWRDEKVIATFPFSSEQWEDVESSPDVLSGFSPKCEYFYLVLYGDFGPESFATKELWLLDVRNESFKLALTGRQEVSYALFDVPVQYVIPSWSPTEEEFVFGDNIFGLEIYNVIRNNRRFLAGPSLKLSSPQWSPASRWIAAQKYGESGHDDFLVVISPDGKEMALSSACPLIFEFAWSPSGKQLAYTCSNASSPQIDSLWVWDVGE